jgi:cyclic pyranopterin phosphate synthase
MLDRLGREINYLRISVTDRCNLRCRYCMPETGVALSQHRDILRFEEIARLVMVAMQLGISRVRLTGGEPLTRRGISRLIELLAANSRLEDLALTTNGLLLASLAAELKQAGLKRVNLSLDTLKPERYRDLTRGGELKAAWNGLEKALEAGLHPVKVNTVLIRGFNDDEILDFCRLAYELPVQVRFIEFMPIGEIGFWKPDSVVAGDEVREAMARKYRLEPDNTGVGSGPAQYWRMESGRGLVGFISAMSHSFCSGCNRLRLTADGRLRACLYDLQEQDVKTPLRNGAGDQELKEIFREAVLAKPERHTMDGWKATDRKMSQIGG